MDLPPEVEHHLRTASFKRAAAPRFTCQVFDTTWNTFVEGWSPIIYSFILGALGPYGKEPLPNIIKMPDAMHSAGATASFNMGTGQITLSSSVDGNPGQTLEKLTHEMTHASLALFPEGDCFYEEGFVDYMVYLMAHAPVWDTHRDEMISAAAFNIKQRRERALRDLSDWDRKRWAGGLFASLARGPFIIAGLSRKKMEGNYTW